MQMFQRGKILSPDCYFFMGEKLKPIGQLIGALKIWTQGLIFNVYIDRI